MSDALKRVRVLDLTVLDDLDFDPVLPCEHTCHDRLHIPGDPAAYLIHRNPCPACGGGGVGPMLLCASGWRQAIAIGRLRCGDCGHRMTVAEGWTIIRTVGSRSA